MKPLEEHSSASDVIRRLQPALANVEGITLFMQPVQDLTVEDRVSRTQFSTASKRRAAELSLWAPRFVQKLQELPQLRDVASDDQNLGLQALLVIDRDAASRFGIRPQAIDDALYSAFGQRQISTIFTQSNQYRVVLEVKPQFQDSCRICNTFACAPPRADRCLSALTRIETSTAPGHQSPGAVSRGHRVVQPGPWRLPWGGGAVIDQARQELGLPASIESGFQGTAKAFEASLTNQSLLILAALVTVYCAGVLCRATSTPLRFSPRCPRLALGALGPLLIYNMDLNVIAIIGIILLIGIVQKNGIMMIDFALDAERTGRQGAARRHLPGVSAAFPSDPDDHHGGLFGAMPLAFGGTGAELRSPLGSP